MTGTGYAPEGGTITRDGAEVDPADHPDVVALARVAAYANDSSVTQEAMPGCCPVSRPTAACVRSG